jgi:hypothetical protein
MISRQQLDIITRILQNEHITLSDLLCGYLTQSEPSEAVIALRKEFCEAASLNTILGTLLDIPQTAPIVARIARNITVRTYVDEISKLLPASAGFHFNVAHASPSQFSAFSSMKMADTFEHMHY